MLKGGNHSWSRERFLSVLASRGDLERKKGAFSLSHSLACIFCHFHKFKEICSMRHEASLLSSLQKTSSTGRAGTVSTCLWLTLPALLTIPKVRGPHVDLVDHCYFCWSASLTFSELWKYDTSQAWSGIGVVPVPVTLPAGYPSHPLSCLHGLSEEIPDLSFLQLPCNFSKALYKISFLSPLPISLSSFCFLSMNPATEGLTRKGSLY